MTTSSERQARVLKALAQCVVWHPDFARAYALAQKSMEATKNRQAATSIMLLGDPGVGKSTLCERIEHEVGVGVATELETEQSHILIMPCVLIELPPSASIKAVAVELLLKLGLEDRERLLRFSSATLTGMIIQRLIVTQTQLVILDEFHRLVDHKTPEPKKKVCRWINHLLNQTTIPIMLAGLPDIEELIDSIPELSDRYPYRKRLRYFDFADKAATALFQKVIAAIEHKVIEPADFTERVSLTQETTFKTICLATAGNFRHLNMLLNDSLTLALAREDNKFTLEDLARAAADLHFCRASNPFCMSASEVIAALKKQYE